MYEKTFGDAEVAEAVNEAFVPVLLKRDQAKELVDSFGIKSFPTTVIISVAEEKQKNKVLATWTGYVPADKFRQRLADLPGIGKVR